MIVDAQIQIIQKKEIIYLGNFFEKYLLIFQIIRKLVESIVQIPIYLMFNSKWPRIII